MPAAIAAQAPCYRCLFPEPPPPEAAPNCAEAGVLGVLPGVIGLLQATEAIKLILGHRRAADRAPAASSTRWRCASARRGCRPIRIARCARRGASFPDTSTTCSSARLAESPLSALTSMNSLHSACSKPVSRIAADRVVVGAWQVDHLRRPPQRGDQAVRAGGRNHLVAAGADHHHRRPRSRAGSRPSRSGP